MAQRLSRQIQRRSGRETTRVAIDQGEIWLGGIHATKRLVIAGVIGSALAFLVFWIAFLALMAWAVSALA